MALEAREPAIEVTPFSESEGGSQEATASAAAAATADALRLIAKIKHCELSAVSSS